MTNSRVEVLPGPGTVIRFGELTIWAGPGVSGDLLSFLAKSARNVAASAHSGRQVADHVANILSGHDPEPGAPFVVVGPADDQWEVLLHGPVQAWDGTRWLAPNPHPGWLRASVVPQPAISIGPAGSPSPRIVMDSPYDLAAGMVPGGGVIVLPGLGEPSGPAGPRRARSGAGPRPSGATQDPADHPPPGTADTGTQGVAHPDIGIPGVGTPAAPTLATPPTDAPAPSAANGSVAAPNGPIVDLRETFASPRAPLPFGLVGAPVDRPHVSGVRCPRGHFNRPGTPACTCCQTVIALDQPEEPGPRPTLGVLLADDGAIYRLQRDLLIGSDPGVDLAAAAGTLDLLTLPSEPGLLAPAHAELRLHDWTLRVVDRGSAAGTFVATPGTEEWTRLTAYTPVDVAPGSHLSLGQRVLTYLSPWR